MKRSAILLLLCATVIIAMAQKPAPDQVETANGPVTIQPVYHAGLVLTWNKLTIYVDPTGGPKAYTGYAPPDFILITHTHPDHMDTVTLNSINTSKATLLVPKAVSDKLTDGLKNKCTIMTNGETTTLKGISFYAIPMYNLPEAPDSFHPKGMGNGYVITLGGKTFYISGDTEDIPEMRGLKNIDVAFVCMNLPYTMDIHQATSAVLDFKPKIVYPYHYRGTEGLSDVEEFKKLVNAGNKDIEVRLRNWYPDYK
jgi:L-ascorbate metabolism protein UlaG (beta-lactamase superfamily)